jgi:hypothetical protein
MTPPAVRSRTTTSTSTPRRPRRATRPAGERRQRTATRPRARPYLCTCGAWRRALGPRRSACAPCAPSRATPSLASRSQSGYSRVGRLPLATGAPGRPPGPCPCECRARLLAPGARRHGYEQRQLGPPTRLGQAPHPPPSRTMTWAVSTSHPAGTDFSSSASAGGGCMPRRTARRSAHAGSRCSLTRRRPRATRRS